MKISRLLILIPFIFIGCGPTEKTESVEPSSGIEALGATSEQVKDAKTIVELREAFKNAIANQDAQALLSLYYTDGLNDVSLEMLVSPIQGTLTETKRWKSYSVSHVETLNYSNFGPGTNGEIIAYYPTKYLSQAFFLSYDYK